MLIFGFHSTSDDQQSHLSNESQLKCEKGSLSHQKIKCSFLDYVKTSDDHSRVIQAMKVDRNVKKGLISHQKMKCSFLDYIQLLMIGRVIQVTKVNQNTKKRPHKSSKNEMLNFGLCSTSDDWQCDPSNES